MPLFSGKGANRASPPALNNSIYRVGTTLIADAQYPVGGGNTYTNVGSTTTVNTPFGKAWTVNGTSQLVRAIMAKPLIVTAGGGMGMVVVFRTSSATTSAAIAGIGSTTGSSGNTLMFMRTGAASAARLNFVVQDSGGSTFHNVTTATTTTNDGLWHCAVFTCQYGPNGQGHLCVDGTEEATATGAAGSPVSTTFDWIVAGGTYRAANVFGAACDVALAAPIFGYIGRHAAMELSANPFQLLQAKQKRFYLGPPAAVGGSFQPAWAVAANSVIYPGARAA